MRKGPGSRFSFCWAAQGVRAQMSKSANTVILFIDQISFRSRQRRCDLLDAPLAQSLSFINRHVRHISRPDVFRARANQLVVGVLFKDMSGPTADATDGEDGRVKVQRNSHHVESR